MEKSHKRLMLVFSAIYLILSGCSSKSLYDAAQQNRLQTCQTLYGAQKEECEARYRKDYETYERERQEVVGKENP